MRYFLFPFQILIALILVSSSLNAQFSGELLNEAEIIPQVGESLPLDAEFVDATGVPVQLAEVTRERPTILCLVYFDCPMLCKLAADSVVKGVTEIDADVGDKFNVVFVSFNPVDTPEKAMQAQAAALAQYGRVGAGAGWYFLTGEQAEIDRLTKAVGYHYRWDPETKQFSHPSGLMIISPAGVITEYLDGVRFSAADLNSAVKRAAAGTETKSETISFARCYLYDPTTGKFGAAVQWTVRTLGLLTVVGLGFTVFRLTRHQHPSRKDSV
ncbi:MAG: hypothetical protein CMJ46_04630 [Planctomyces sp.]|nr:hypothetical protein [Planctomyces sp.]